ncbi:MAG: DUF6573 family protein [Gemmataceae bacterium]
MNDEFTTIHTYSRRRALAAGVLVDATAMAREAGFQVPLALTAAAWAECVSVPEGASCQDEAGRLWDVLSTLRFAIRLGLGDSGSSLRYSLYVLRRPSRRPESMDLKAVCGPDDDGSPCVTVMLPGED